MPRRHTYAAPTHKQYDGIPQCSYSWEWTDSTSPQSSIPVFRPTWEEFEDFERFVDAVHHVGCYFGLVKVIPPPEWQPYVDDCGKPVAYSETAAAETLERDTEMRVKKPVRQIIRRAYGQKSDESGAYLALPEYIFPDGGETTVEGFYKLAERQELTPTTRQHKYLEDEDYAAIERSIYQSLALNEGNTRTRFYGADSLGTLFPDELKQWNLDMLPGPLLGLDDLQGINTSMLYFGRFASLFAWHGEDCNMHSANFHHLGAAKVWRTVGSGHIHRFEQLVRKFFDSDYRRCDQAMRHKHFIMTPTFLASHGIPTRVVVQKPGEFILTFPNTVHCGFNAGINVNEAVNFVNEAWLEDGLRSKRCVCRLKSGAPNLDMNYLISAMNLQNNARLQELLKQYNLNDENDAVDEALLDVESDTDAVDVLLCPYKRCRHARQALPTVADFVKHLKDKHSNKDSDVVSEEQRLPTTAALVSTPSASSTVSVLVQHSNIAVTSSFCHDEPGPASGPCSPVAAPLAPFIDVEVIDIDDVYECSYNDCSSAARTFHDEVALLQHYLTYHTAKAAAKQDKAALRPPFAEVASPQVGDELLSQTTTVSITRHFRKRKAQPPVDTSVKAERIDVERPSTTTQKRSEAIKLPAKDIVKPDAIVGLEHLATKPHKRAEASLPPTLSKLTKSVIHPLATLNAPPVPKLSKLVKPLAVPTPAELAAASVDNLLADLSNTISSLQRTR